MKKKRSKKNQKLSFKRRKTTEEAESELEAEKGTLKITDLNTDCLEYIFDFLDFDNLLNVGQSNTVLNYPAGITLKRKFGSDVKIQAPRHDILNPYAECRIGNTVLNEIQCQNLISFFGDFISSIELHRLDNLVFVDNIFYQISKHTLESLVKIDFSFFPEGWLRAFAKPLPKVESVELFSCNLLDDKLVLSDIFPKLNHLKVSTDFGLHSSLIETHFPDLKKLELLNMYALKTLDFELLVSLNPQLLSCTYEHFNQSMICYDSSFVKFIAEQTKLEKFKLKSECKPKKHFHFKNIKHFVYSSVDRESFPFSFDQLETLKLSNNILIDDIIKQNRKLVKLSLFGYSLMFNFLSNELATLPSLSFDVSMRYVHEDYWRKNIDVLAEFLNEKCSATNIKFKHDNNKKPITEYFVSKINKSKWKLNQIKRYSSSERRWQHKIYITKVKNQ